MKSLLLHVNLLLLLFGVYSQAQTIPNSMLLSKNAYEVLDIQNDLNIVKKKGDYTLVSPFGDESEINWAKKFNIVELGNVENVDVTYDMLNKKGLLHVKHPIGYDWMPAFYYYTEGKNRVFVDWLYENKNITTLNPEGPFIHCKENHYDWCQDYYYNLANKEVLDKRVEDLLTNIKLRGFKGLFFDWASGSYIEEENYNPMLQNFNKLDTKQSYFDFVSKFYKKLKESNIFVVTNQGFRKAEYILPFVNYDMTESYITTDVRKKIKIELAQKGWVNSVMVTNYYPIYEDSKDIKDSLKFIDFLSKYKKKYKKFGFKNFIYLNYLAPEYKKVYESRLLYKMVKPKNGIYFSYAMAKLTDSMVYAEITQNRKLERDEVYFYDLGHALGKTYHKLDAIEGYIRFYEKGFVLVSKAYNKELYLKISSRYLKKNAKVYDAYNKKGLKVFQQTITIDLQFQKESFTQKYLPLGRVYLYF